LGSVATDGKMLFKRPHSLDATRQEMLGFTLGHRGKFVANPLPRSSNDIPCFPAGLSLKIFAPASPDLKK